ncbi:MAG: glycosyltransferase family 4 protein [Candidatus Limnocylindrales bacterium]
MSPDAGRPASVLLVHERYRQRAGEDAVFDAELELLRARGHDVEAMIVDNDAIPDDPGPVEKVRLGLETVWSYRASALIRRRLDERPVDVVHVHNSFPLLSPSIYGVTGRSGAAVVQTIHNYRPLCPAATLFRDGKPCEDCVGQLVAVPSVVHGCYRGSRLQTLPVALMLATTRVLRTWRHVDAFIALTDFAATKLAEGGLPGDRIHVKANFVSPDPGVRQGSGDGFLFVGRLAAEKGIGTLVDAAPLLDAGITVRIAGDGPEAVRLADAAAGLGALQPLGRLERSDVQHELERCRAVVFPSLWYEGLPMVILEAFAAGVPVIAARLGAAATLVRDGETGLTFDPGDPAGLAACLRWAQSHPDEMAKFGQAGRARYEAEFTADASHRRLVDIYGLARSRAAGRVAA